MQREDLRTDVAVQAHQAHVLSGQHVADALEGEVLAHGEAELRVLATGADVLVGVGLNAGGDAHVHVLHHVEAPGDLVHAGQLDAAVQHDASHTGGDGLFQFAGRLVVAVDEHALHGEVYRAGAGQLAAAEAEALTWPGVYYVRTWLNEGRCEVGDSLMYVLIGADIRPNCIDALQKLVGHIKNELVVEKEIFA